MEGKVSRQGFFCLFFLLMHSTGWRSQKTNIKSRGYEEGWSKQKLILVFFKSEGRRTKEKVAGNGKDEMGREIVQQ